MKRLLLVFLCWGALLLAEETVSEFPLLDLPMTARQSALAESFASHPLTTFSTIANPAILRTTSKNELELLQSQTATMANYYYTGLVLNTAYLPIGINYISLGIDSMQETAASLDMTGEVQVLGELAYKTEVLVVGSAYRLLNNLSIGMNYKHLQAEISSDAPQARGYTISVGMYAEFIHLSLGLVADNIAGQLDYQQQSEKLPTSLTFSTLNDLGKTSLILEFKKSAENDGFARGGLVYELTSNIELLAGLKRSQFTAGASYFYKNIVLDYAYLSETAEYLAAENRVSLRIKW